MRFPWLKSALAAEAPFLSIYVDTTRKDKAEAADLSARWAHLRARAAKQGAPETVLTEIEEAVLTPSEIGGRHGRAFIANSSGMLIDRVLPVPPLEDVSEWGPRPVLLPMMRVAARAVSVLLVEADRSGADFRLRGPDDPRPAGGTSELGDQSSVQGSHDELHKARNGWRGHKFETRVEDSWERNAETVALKLNKLVGKYRPDLVILTGDVRATALLAGAVGQEVAARLKEVPGGTRGTGLERPAFKKEVSAVTDEFIRARERAVAERLRQEQARDGQSVAGAVEVMRALDRGQVDDLVLVDGGAPDNIEEVLFAAVQTDAGVQSADAGVIDLPDGVGALLRWKDESTRSNSISSQSGDPAREHRPAL
ncbi:baeRF2 domain-containing protein [Spelaeicoccus albus]|uniref:Peptide chain release factor 1 n=1 Tax=Spelaeicoccus albus TaxID=1280376 RepID=A0A7Z0IIG4_9MICO|nr:hypothetical protein [Spelaeicoccus albus]NYI68450.1 hypothetical protein [Spelaeicoccus albus]